MISISSNSYKRIMINFPNPKQLDGMFPWEPDEVSNFYGTHLLYFGGPISGGGYRIDGFRAFLGEATEDMIMYIREEGELRKLGSEWSDPFYAFVLDSPVFGVVCMKPAIGDQTETVDDIVW